MKTIGSSAEVSINLYCCMYPDCTSEYSTKFNLKRHVESVHMHLKKYQCNLCSSNFSSKQSLKEHLRIHSGFMPFKCTACDKSFRQASQLSLHKRIHILEGRDSGFTRVKVDEEFYYNSPVQVCLEVNKDKFCLPELSVSRRGIFSLPFPTFF